MGLLPGTDRQGEEGARPDEPAVRFGDERRHRIEIGVIRVLPVEPVGRDRLVEHEFVQRVEPLAIRRRIVRASVDPDRFPL